MHRSLKLLRISEDERELKSRTRLLRLYLSKHLFPGLTAVLFIGLALLSATIAYKWTFVTPLQPAGGGVMETRDWLMFWAFFLVLTLGFGAAGFAFARGLFKDPILAWLLHPHDFVFAPGTIQSAVYLSSDSGRRTFSRMRATVKAEAKAEELNAFLMEDFSSDAWIFGRSQNLALPVYVLISRKGRSRAALVGISAAAIDRAMAKVHARR
ncbi:MAG: hypothetical protein A2X94_12625 [Bdellovibrionales bacterium GWB1_55_8]|nr:MAG: hypothetical protein A2X94_12625 [Bdellovibrionales bacterium GWB1_55_8]